MKCPYCGAEMEAGTLHQMDEAFWEPREKPQKKGFLKSLFSSINAIRLIEYKTNEGWLPSLMEVPARHCPNCRIFLFRGRLDRDEEG